MSSQSRKWLTATVVREGFWRCTCFEVVGCGWREEDNRVFKIPVHCSQPQMLFPLLQREFIADLRKSW